MRGSVRRSEYKNLLTDRRCAQCARGEQGLQCEQCTRNTLRLRSGDVIAFNGFAAVHGVSRVNPEEPARKGPPLPQWAQNYLQKGCRLSVQWRLTDAKIAKKALERDQQMWSGNGASSSAAPPGAAAPFSGVGQRLGGGDGGLEASMVQLAEDGMIAAAILPSEADERKRKLEARRKTR